MKDKLLSLMLGLIFGVSIGLISLYVNKTQITVLEVHIQVVDSEKYHRIIYNEKSFKVNITRSIDFKTTSGVNNYINQVADENMSEWRPL